mgnify:CR=1 FL=1
MKTNSIPRLRHLVFTLLIFAVSSMRGQTLYALKIDQNIRLEAKEITARYQPHLVMGADQAMDFQSTVGRFLVKKRAVEQDPNLSDKAKYDLLKRLSSRETAEMADVLESYRWQEYMRIKVQIQPIPEPNDLRKNLVVQE